MRAQAFLYWQKVQKWGLRHVGWVLTWGEGASHSSVYIKREHDDGSVECWMTEMSSTRPGPDTEVIGYGYGYMIQWTRVCDVQGELLPDCDCEILEYWARRYASVTNGDLNSFTPTRDRDWYDDPQGYGGPMYDVFRTCNTYVSWILKKSCDAAPSRPPGSIGWGYTPKFPGPIS